MRGSVRLRVLAVGMAVVLCLGGLAGCSSGDAGKTSLSDTGAAEEVQKDEAAEAAEAARKAAEEAEARAEAEAQAEAERQAAEEAARIEAERQAAEEAARAEAERQAAEEAAAQAEAERIAAEEAARAEAEAQAAREAEEAAQAAAESDSYTVYITKTGGEVPSRRLSLLEEEQDRHRLQRCPCSRLRSVLCLQSLNVKSGMGYKRTDRRPVWAATCLIEPLGSPIGVDWVRIL